VTFVADHTKVQVEMQAMESQQARCQAESLHQMHKYAITTHSRMFWWLSLVLPKLMQIRN